MKVLGQLSFQPFEVLGFSCEATNQAVQNPITNLRLSPKSSHFNFELFSSFSQEAAISPGRLVVLLIHMGAGQGNLLVHATEASMGWKPCYRGI